MDNLIDPVVAVVIGLLVLILMWPLIYVLWTAGYFYIYIVWFFLLQMFKWLYRKLRK